MYLPSLFAAIPLPRPRLAIVPARAPSALDAFDIEPGCKQNSKAVADLIIAIEQDELGLRDFEKNRRGIYRTINFYHQLNRKHNPFWVLRDKTTGRVVGCAGMAKTAMKRVHGKDEPSPNVPNPKRTAMLYNFYLAPEIRGTGVGRALLERLMTEARDAGMEQVILAVRNPRAIGMYERMGFETYHRYDHIRPNGDVHPSVRMWKPL